MRMPEQRKDSSFWQCMICGDICGVQQPYAFNALTLLVGRQEGH